MPLEARHQVAHRGDEVVGEPGVGLVFVVGMAVGVERRGIADLDRNGAALQADALHPLGGVLPVDVEVVAHLLAGRLVDHRRVHQLHVQDRRVAVVGGAVGTVDIHLALQQPPVGPHVLGHAAAVRIAALQFLRQAQQVPVLAHPGADRQHDRLRRDVAQVGVQLSDRSSGQVVAGDLDAGENLDAVLGALFGEARHRLARTGVARGMLEVRDLDPVGVEVRPDRLQEALGLLSDVEVGAVAAGVVAFDHRLVVGLLVGLSGGDVADLLESEADRIRLPDVDRMPQDRMQLLRHVEVAHAAAGDAGGAGARAGLVQDDDVLAAALAAPFQLHRQMPGGGEAVHAGADDDETLAFGQD